MARQIRENMLISDHHRSYSTQTGVSSNTRTTQCYQVQPYKYYSCISEMQQAN